MIINKLNNNSRANTLIIKHYTLTNSEYNSFKKNLEEQGYNYQSRFSKDETNYEKFVKTRETETKKLLFETRECFKN